MIIQTRNEHAARYTAWNSTPAYWSLTLTSWVLPPLGAEGSKSGWKELVRAKRKKDRLSYRWYDFHGDSNCVEICRSYFQRVHKNTRKVFTREREEETRPGPGPAGGSYMYSQRRECTPVPVPHQTNSLRVACATRRIGNMA